MYVNLMSLTAEYMRRHFIRICTILSGDIASISQPISPGGSNLSV